MNDPTHPAVDELADHHAGLLAGDRAAVLSWHLASCADCRSAVGAIDEVADVLAAEGRRIPVMPASAASSLDAALARAAAERAGQIPRIEERRAARGASAASGRRRSAWPVLAAAAVAVIATAVGVNVVQGGGGSADSAAGGAGEADSGAEAASKNQPASPGDAEPPASAARAAEQRLRDHARALDRGSRQPVPPAGRCATPSSEHGTGPVSLVSFRGSREVAVLDTETRTVTILDCASATKELFATDY